MVWCQLCPILLPLSLHSHGDHRGIGSERDKGSRDSGGSAGNAFGPAEQQRRAIAGDGTTHREGIRGGHGHAAEDAGLV